MTRPQPWHDKALKLRAAGLSLVKTANECDISVTTLKRFLTPSYRERQAKLNSERRAERLKADPAYRAKYNANRIPAKRLYARRIMAKCEAYDTGRRYEDVCAAWDITP